MQLLKLSKPIELLTSSLPVQLMAIATSIGAFFAPEAFTFLVVLIAIIFDAVFGIMVARKMKLFVLSKLMRETGFKIISYGAALIIVLLAEKLLHETGLVGVKIAAGWALACEFWSMSASILILKPNAYFFRIMQVHLKGEIESKLGTELDDILPDNKVVKP